MLSSAPWLANLTSLDLAHNRLGAPGHRALSLPRLRSLSLRHSDIDAAGLVALASAPWLTQLTELRLAETGFVSAHAYESIRVAIDDDVGVFGRLRRLGCIVEFTTR